MDSEQNSDICNREDESQHMGKLERFWYVLHTKSRFENVVNEGLIKKSFEVFLPKIKVRSRRRDRRR